MKLRTSGLAVTALTTAMGLAATPDASAQRRADVRSTPRSTVVVQAYYYRPLFYDPWWGGPWYPGAFYGYPRYPYLAYYDVGGSLRLQVTPRETEVFIDGYYAGTVDDFDGVFQRLRVEPGPHDLELYLPGHRSVRQQVYLQPGRTSHLRLTMAPLAPGEPEPGRPESAPIDRSDRSSDAIRPVPRDQSRTREQAGPAGARNESSYGGVSIRVQPEGATILIDGERWEGPAADERLVVEMATGRHTIQIEKDGYRPYTTDVTVRNGVSTTLNVVLTPQE